MIGRLSLILLITQWSVAAALAQGEEPPAPELVALGEALFHDPRLSRDGTLSCASCHDLSYAGADTRGVSFGIGGVRLRRNAPSVYNAVFNFRQTWDGRARTLEEQVLAAMQGELEMAIDWEKSIRLLVSDAQVSSRFYQLFGEAPSKKRVLAALSAFQSTLVTLDTPYDRHLAGEEGALTPLQQQGLELFHTLGCNSCHDGPHLGGNQFQHVALFFEFGSDQELIRVAADHHGVETASVATEEEEDHLQELGNFERVDRGRFEVTGLEEDRMVFKVPMLRNVSLTPPYFHNGSANTLEAAVFEMAEHQLGVLLSELQIEQLVAFLNALSSERLRGIEWHGQ